MNRFGHQFETIKCKPWSQIDLVGYLIPNLDTDFLKLCIYDFMRIN